MPPSHFIPPLSVVRLSRSSPDTPAWRNQIGREFRIGYYSKKDGLNCIWLVNDAGEYEQTIDFPTLTACFDVVTRSNERSKFGARRSPIPPLPHASRKGSPKPLSLAS